MPQVLAHVCGGAATQVGAQIVEGGVAVQRVQAQAPAVCQTVFELAEDRGGVLVPVVPVVAQIGAAAQVQVAAIGRRGDAGPGVAVGAALP
ncbi:hypothetical protein SDC9_197132 [bioreactor metagenome]|uniref:Uncharacterized protein n=1 Tax=bioreactor metagenome TaxID=1076179 RepID=A0A645IDU8_9ZZZZ